jgi:hypothetical protein
MKRKKLLRKIEALLSADRRVQIAKADSLEMILNKLEAKAVDLRGKLDEEKDEAERRDLLRKLSVIKAQHGKGEKLRAELAPLRASDD